MRRKSCAHRMVIARGLDMDTHMPYSVLTFQISSQLSHTHSLIHCLSLSALDRVIHPVHVWRLSEGISSILQIHSQILGLAHLSSR